MKYMMAAMVVAVTFGLAGCTKDNTESTPDNPTPTPAPTPTPQQPPEGDLAIRYGAVDGPYVYDGDTVVYTTTDFDMNSMHRADIYIYIDNQTTRNLTVSHTLDAVEGPANLETATCAGGHCPWDGLPYLLGPGVESDKPFTIEASLLPEYSGQSIIYRFVTGKTREAGAPLEDPVTVYVRINVQ